MQHQIEEGVPGFQASPHSREGKKSTIDRVPAGKRASQRRSQGSNKKQSGQVDKLESEQIERKSPNLSCAAVRVGI